MKMLITLGIILALTAMSSLARTWTRGNGTTIDGEFVKTKAGFVVIKKENGKSIQLPISTLSQEDQNVISDIKAGKPISSASDKSSGGIPGRKFDMPKHDGWKQWDAGSTHHNVTTGKQSVGYHMYLPSNYDPGNPPPVLFLFHPGGSGRGIMKAFRKSADKAGWIIVGCDKVRNGMTTLAGLPMVIEIMHEVGATVPHNPSRMYLGGFSGGASRAYHTTALLNAPFAGVIACGGWLGGRKAQKADFRKHMAIAMVNGTKDGGARGWTKSDTEALAKRKCEVKHFDFEGGHRIPPRKALDEAMDWMEKDWKSRGHKYTD